MQTRVWLKIMKDNLTYHFFLELSTFKSTLLNILFNLSLGLILCFFYILFNSL